MRTRRVYTGSGLRRVKPYIQFLVLVFELRMKVGGPRKDAPAHLILADGQGRCTQSPGRLQHGNLSKVIYNIIPWSSDYLAAQPTSSALPCTPSYPNESDEVVWRIF
jgi:hypothetical protein